MARKKKEMSVEEKLRTLYNLQLIDSRIDNIKIVRGELPLEVQDLEDDLVGLENRLAKTEEELNSLEAELSGRKNTIEEAKALIVRYTEQQNNVRNNREFDSLTKEIEYQNLEIQLAEKKIKEANFAISNKAESMQGIKDAVSAKMETLNIKKGELDAITSETQKEEEALTTLSKEIVQKVDERLFTAYSRIRSKAKNGLAIVTIDRQASNGSYIQIPPQRQMEVANRQKLIIDEYSGRILIDAELAEEQSIKVEKMIKKALKDI